MKFAENRNLRKMVNCQNNHLHDKTIKEIKHIYQSHFVLKSQTKEYFANFMIFQNEDTNKTYFSAQKAKSQNLGHSVWMLHQTTPENPG